MSVAEIERFEKDLRGSDDLQEEFKAVGSDENAMAAFAGGKGYDFTTDELKGFLAQKKGELSEEDLDKVAAAGIPIHPTVLIVTHSG